METYYFIANGEMTVFQVQFMDPHINELEEYIKMRYNKTVRRKDCGKITKLNNEIEYEKKIHSEYTAVKLTEYTKEDIEFAWDVEFTEEEWESFAYITEENTMPDAVSDFINEQRDYFLEYWLENGDCSEETIKKFTN